MSKPYVLGRFKPRLVYYGLSLKDAVKVMDFYVAYDDSDKFNEAGIFEHFSICMHADEDGDEYHSEFTGTYSVMFESHTYHASDNNFEDKVWRNSFNELENLYKLIESELGFR